MQPEDVEVIADVIAEAVRQATAPLLAKIADLEARPFATPELWQGLSDSLVDMRGRLSDVEAKAQIPGPKGDAGERGADGGTGQAGADGANGRDGKDVDLVFVKTLVLEAVAALPAPKDGLNGKDAVLERGALEAAVQAVLEGLPKPKDGIDGQPGPAGADGRHGKDAELPDVEAIALRAAQLVPLPKDGRDGQPGAPGGAGRDGKDVDPLLVKSLVAEAVAAIPAPRDGRDGKDGRDGTLEGASLKQIDARTVEVCRPDGSVLGSFRTVSLTDRGVFKEGTSYEAGDGVTFAGSFFIAQEDTTSKPETDRTWRLAVKRGRDGKNGPQGQQGGPGPKGDPGTPGRDR